MSTRHGQLADGNTTITVVVSEELKSELQALADLSERKLSDYLRRELTKIVKAEKQRRGAILDAALDGESPAAPRRKGK